MFNWFKKEATVKSTIQLKHKDGGIINIVVEGSDDRQVSYVANKIKESFNLPVPQFPQDEVDKVFADMNKAFDELGKAFNGKFEKY